MLPSNPCWKTRLHSSTPNPQGNCLDDPTCICKLNSLETRLQQNSRQSTYGMLWDFFSLLHKFFWGGKQHCWLEMGEKLFPILWAFSETSACFHSVLGQRKQNNSKKPQKMFQNFKWSDYRVRRLPRVANSWLVICDPAYPACKPTAAGPSSRRWGTSFLGHCEAGLPPPILMYQSFHINLLEESPELTSQTVVTTGLLCQACSLCWWLLNHLFEVERLQ